VAVTYKIFVFFTAARITSRHLINEGVVSVIMTVSGGQPEADLYKWMVANGQLELGENRDPYWAIPETTVRDLSASWVNAPIRWGRPRWGGVGQPGGGQGEQNEWGMGRHNHKYSSYQSTWFTHFIYKILQKPVCKCLLITQNQPSLCAQISLRHL